MGQWKIFLIATPLFFSFFGLSFGVLTFGASTETDAAELSAPIDPAWLKRHNLSAANAKEAAIDHDSDGLTLLQEYRYRTDPKVTDTDADGYSDGEEVSKGYSPTGEGRIDVDEDGLPDNWEEKNGLNTAVHDAKADLDGDRVMNQVEYAYGTDPKKADTDGDQYSDREEIDNGYDPVVAGSRKSSIEILIPKLKITAPVVLSSSFSDEVLLEDLKSGVIRYPTTAAPGQDGNMVLSGHSSNYAWVKSDYNYIFRSVNKLVVGDEIQVHVTGGNQKKLEYTYRVTGNAIVLPDDPQIFAATDTPTLTLVTCWPLGTALKRYIITAELVP